MSSRFVSMTKDGVFVIIRQRTIVRRPWRHMIVKLEKSRLPMFSPISVQSKMTIAMISLLLWEISSSRASLHVFSTRVSGATFLRHHSVFGSRFTFVKLEES